YGTSEDWSENNPDYPGRRTLYFWAAQSRGVWLDSDSRSHEGAGAGEGGFAGCEGRVGAERGTGRPARVRAGERPLDAHSRRDLGMERTDRLDLCQWRRQHDQGVVDGKAWREPLADPPG